MRVKEMNNYQMLQREKMDRESELHEMETDFIKGLTNIQLGDVAMDDYPDFSDAYVVSADREDGTPLTEYEVDKLNEDHPEVAWENAFEWLL